MNFGMLKNMIDNLITAYSCAFCGSKNISEQNIDIIGAAWNTVNIDMECPSCKKHFMAKTEVVQVNASNINTETLKKLQNSLLALRWKIGWDITLGWQALKNNDSSKKVLLRDEEIISLQKELKEKKILKVEDLFFEE